ncbi:helix-turn-helix transcriptional regulator [Palleronia sp. LCG004]|uniref:helix-turn-helix transcriptional regulator n=1 Tax=Palleronia sp. LCG004 TaxID=3079304 RepID=UPI002943C890|nr:helix-turn-helix transcriptional regulator [Palleronia sp. LCG004]WOI56587.1 helix-turn-helix transcriptional regulator [Palleronia sp. LCG004]
MMTAALQKRWNDGVGDLLVHRDSSDIVDRFLFHLSDCVEFDQWYTALFHRSEPPERLAFHGIRHGKDDYEEGYYLLDPFYQKFRQDPRRSVHRLDDISMPSRAKSTYFESYLGKWETRDEVGYLVPVGKNKSMHLSISRSNDMPYFETGELVFLESLVNLVGVIFSVDRHRSELDEEMRSARMHDMVDEKVSDFGAGILSAREREIALLQLKGYTARSIAGLTGITEGTAKIHMKNIYRKMGVRSQVDLLVNFFDTLYV